MAAAAQTHPPYWPSALRLHRGERLRYVYDFGAHVNMDVDRPSCIELHVHEKVQFDRLQPTAADGYVAEQHGALLAPGVTQLQLGKGLYHFRTLDDAPLRVISGGVQVASTSAAGKDKWPDPKATHTDGHLGVVAGLLGGRARRCINASNGLPLLGRHTRAPRPRRDPSARAPGRLGRHPVRHGAGATGSDSAESSPHGGEGATLVAPAPRGASAT